MSIRDASPGLTCLYSSETIESLFYFYRYTHDRRYQDMAWDIFNSIHTYCRANSGFSGVGDVDSYYPKWDDRQERYGTKDDAFRFRATEIIGNISFLFAETLKYLYLLFDEPGLERLPLNEWVFNTEAHPLRITSQIPPAPPKRPDPPSSEDRKSWFVSFLQCLIQWLKFIFVPYLDCFHH